jgi:uncharacterized protein (UPF0332 family)
VKPETSDFLAYAHTMLERGHMMLGVSLYEEAGRAAYMACFHATQGLIFERDNRVMKTHSGVRSEFHRLTRTETRIDNELRGFLTKAYKFKDAADYDPSSQILTTAEDTQAVLHIATRFVETITTLLSIPPTGNGAGSA